MTRPPNNFPAEGDHGTVTADELREREHRKWDDHSPVEYMVNAGQDDQAIVRTTVSAQRQATIDKGHRILRQASNDLGNGLQQAARKPLAVDFKLVKGESQAHLDQRSQVQDQTHGQEV